jgi:DNA-binding PadR family transcriptional regulator
MASIGGSGLAGPTWLRVLYHLVSSPKTPTEIANLEKKHLSVVSRTLRDLRTNGLVVYTKTGSRERYYRPTEEGYILIRQFLR